MNKEKYFVIWYKSSGSDTLQHKKMYLPYEECEKICKQEGYTYYNIADLSTYKAMDLHILTDVVHFDDKYYFPEEQIPYPTSHPEIMRDFQSKITLENNFYYDDVDYQYIYNDVKMGETFYTSVEIEFILPEKTIEIGLLAQTFIIDFKKFLENFEKNDYAVYQNEEFSPFTWIAWSKDDRVRLIHQDYRAVNVEICFDVLLDKEWFMHFCYNLLDSITQYAEDDLKHYNAWKRKNNLI